jgi:hypothetical protein
MAVSLVSTGVTFPDSSTQITAATGFGFKNRIINGAMVIDQRNAGASVTPGVTGAYAVDRWFSNEDTDGVITVEQVEDAPAGFYQSAKVTVTTADASLGASQNSQFRQAIEGNNIVDLNWGSANAATVTVSFWVKSSLTGTFGGSLRNATPDRSYIFQYTILSANTWEQKTVTIAGDTSGTWGTGTGVGIYVTFDLGSGTDRNGTANQWQAGSLFRTSSNTSLISTLNATWQITGVQLEKGSTATSFDNRPYGTELALCQRYLPAVNRQGTDVIGFGQSISATQGLFFVPFQVTPRVNPTGITTSAASGFYAINTIGTIAYAASLITIGVGGSTGATLNVTYANNGGAAGQANGLYTATAGAQILFTGCEL